MTTHSITFAGVRSSMELLREIERIFIDNEVQIQSGCFISLQNEDAQRMRQLVLEAIIAVGSEQRAAKRVRDDIQAELNELKQERFDDQDSMVTAGQLERAVRDFIGQVDGLTEIVKDIAAPAALKSSTPFGDLYFVDAAQAAGVLDR